MSNCPNGRQYLSDRSTMVSNIPAPLHGLLGAISGSNYQAVHKLSHAAVPNRDGRQNRDILLISVMNAMGEIHDGFKLFPGLERKRTPRSEHVYALLEPYADNTLYVGADCEEFFDRAEIIMSIEYMHIEHPEPVGQDERPWSPIGRFGWKTSPRNPLEPMIAEASTAGKSWEPARAGLFGGLRHEVCRTWRGPLPDAAPGFLVIVACVSSNPSSDS